MARSSQRRKQRDWRRTIFLIISILIVLSIDVYKRQTGAKALSLTDGHTGMDTFNHGLGRAIQHLGDTGQTVRGGDHYRLTCQPRPLTTLDGDRQVWDDEISNPAHIAWGLSATRTPSSIMRTIAWPPGSLQRLRSTVICAS